MNIPDEVMRIFVKEAESTNYGKVSLGIIRRGSHVHYTIEKFITMKINGEAIDSEKNEKTIEV